MSAETGDDVQECEHADLRIAQRPVTRMQRRGLWLRPILDCAGVVADCYGFTHVYWRDRYRWRSVRGRTRVICDTETVPCATRARSEWVRLGRRARRALRRDGRLEIHVISAFDERADPRYGPRRLASQFFLMRRSGPLRGDPSPILRPEDLP